MTIIMTFLFDDENHKKGYYIVFLCAYYDNHQFMLMFMTVGWAH